MAFEAQPTAPHFSRNLLSRYPPHQLPDILLSENHCDRTRNRNGCNCEWQATRAGFQAQILHVYCLVLRAIQIGALGRIHANARTLFDKLWYVDRHAV